jgi:hypothetical protein
LTEDLTVRICQGVSTGAPLEVAAQAMGIPPGVFWEWMARGEGRDPDRPQTPLYADFAERVRRAEAECHLLLMGVVRNAAVQGHSWEASRAALKMRWAKYYAERTEVSGPEGRAIPLEITGVLEGMTDGDLDALLARLRAARTGGGGEGAEEEDPGVSMEDDGTS